jgi:Domain of unknown function (DUF3597)
MVIGKIVVVTTAAGFSAACINLFRALRMAYRKRHVSMQPNNTESRSVGISGSIPSASFGQGAGKPMTQAELEAMIANLANKQGEDYDWKRSIVDLMKLLKLDSSISARNQLAKELGYKGELNGSVEMNIWLHKQVMTRLAETGGEVPDSPRWRSGYFSSPSTR